MSLPLKEYFTYHPPTTSEREEKHKQVNESALGFAEVLDKLVDDESYKKACVFAILFAKMMANQAITNKDLESK